VNLWYFGQQCPILNIVSMFKGMGTRGYDMSTEQYLVNYFYYSNLKSILLAKYSGLKEINIAYKKMKYCYGSKLGFWLFHVPVLYLPNSLIRILIHLYKRIKD